MASSTTASTSYTSGLRCKRKRDYDNAGICGMTIVEYEGISASLDSDEEPLVDSGSEYEPDQYESDASDESSDETELEQNNHVTTDNDNSEIDEQRKILALNWDNTAFKPTIHTFDDTHSGLQESLEDKSNALSYFLFFLNSEVVKLIIDETNKYSSENKNKKQKMERNR